MASRAGLNNLFIHQQEGGTIQPEEHDGQVFSLLIQHGYLFNCHACSLVHTGYGASSHPQWIFQCTQNPSVFYPALSHFGLQGAGASPSLWWESVREFTSPTQCKHRRSNTLTFTLTGNLVSPINLEHVFFNCGTLFMHAQREPAKSTQKEIWTVDVLDLRAECEPLLHQSD